MEKLQQIKNEITLKIEEVFDGYYEVETFINTEYDEMNWIDIRLYGGDCVDNDAVQNILHNGTDLVCKYADNIGGEVPNADEVKFGFSGVRFERVYIEFPEDVNFTGSENIIVNGGELWALLVI